MTLAEFLLARIAEDERDAREADESRLWAISQANDRIISDAGHMQRFMPTRVLAECEAKRRIIKRTKSRHVLVPLAGVYADHPDYRDEWRPGVGVRAWLLASRPRIWRRRGQAGVTVRSPLGPGLVNYRRARDEWRP